MTRRATKKASLASSASRTHLAAVPEAHFARMLDGSVVFVVAKMQGGTFVRDDGPNGRGPCEMPGSEVVAEHWPREATYTQGGDVKDPLDRGGA